jgi:urease accessory protein
MNLRLLQIADSALPISGYTHSWGLETAIARGLVHDAASLESWTRGWLWHSLRPLEAVIVSVVARAVLAEQWDTVRRANDLLRVSVAPPSLRRASQEMGELLLFLAATWSWSAAGVQRFVGRPYHHAVVFGLLGALAGATALEIVTAYSHQAALGMISAGVRAVPVGHTHGQQILAYLHDDIGRLAGDVLDRDLATAGSGCPFYEVLCDEHGSLFARLFRS